MNKAQENCLCFFHLWDAEVAPFADINQEDKVFSVPYRNIKYGLDKSIEMPDRTFFISLENGDWTFEEEPYHEEMAVEIRNGEILSPQNFITI